MGNPADVVNANMPASQQGTPASSSAQAPSSQPSGSVNMIRNISQTVQEREIVKTAPDVVVFIDGLPYLINLFVNDPRNGNQTTLVNFNDHVTSFSATYDTDTLVPNCTVSLQIPNYQKYLYQMPGGNNLIQTMAQIQVYAKGYYMAGGTNDTVYRRVFKGVTSNIGYNDNGKTLEVSIQCHGIMFMLEKMQVNIHPSVNTSYHTGTHQTIWQSVYGSGDCFQVLAAVFLDALRSDMFQFGSLNNITFGKDPFSQAVERGFMAKWQAILWNMVSDVHIFGPFKDNLGQTNALKKGQKHGDPGKNVAHNTAQRVTSIPEKDLVSQYSTYYGNIQTYYPFRNITALDLKNSVIVNRLDVIREVVQKMDYEAYQDLDGKIIIKPPLYNLDVVNLGTQIKSTQTAPNSNNNSLLNPATAITEQNNPFVVYLSEMLTEQESEDQAAIRRTRTTVCGNIVKSLGVNFDDFMKQVAEYIDIPKLAKFGLREEPLQQVPWIQEGQKVTLFAHAAAETARANRGYRTYSFTIPLRPELKLGFPVYIPHKDMYAYIKTISINFSIGGTATMTVNCDSIRRRVYVNTQQTSGSGNSQQGFSAYTPAPDLVYQWTKSDSTTQQFNAVNPNPDGSPSVAQSLAQKQALQTAGTTGGVSNNSANISQVVGTGQSLATPLKNTDGSSSQPTPEQLKLYAVSTQGLATKLGIQFDTPFSTYIIKNDGDVKQGTVDKTAGKFIKVEGKSVKNTNNGPGFFTSQRPADLSYIQALCGNPTTKANSVIPFTDGKGYEVIAPFPWGRYIDLITALKTFTEQGFLPGTTTDVNGNSTQDLQDLRILQNSNAFLFAGLGTPSSTGDPSSTLQTALLQQQQLIGGSSTSYAPQVAAASAGTPKQKTGKTATSGGVQQSNYQPDATVIVLHYDPTQPATNGTNSLLNAAQPEDKFAAALLGLNNPNSQQHIVDVLVSGNVAPSKTVKEALIATQIAPSQVAQPQNVQILKAINRLNPAVSGTPSIFGEQGNTQTKNPTG